jgi:hypothetical protein
MRIVLAALVALLAACAARPDAPLASEQGVLDLARERTAEACASHELGCDIEASRIPEGWFVTVTPILGVASDGQNLFAIHSGWNFVYSPTDEFKGDRGW